MSAAFSKLCKRLGIATAVAVLLPLGAATLLGGASAAANGDTALTQATDTPTPLTTLGRADAAACISPDTFPRPNGFRKSCPIALLL